MEEFTMTLSTLAAAIVSACVPVAAGNASVQAFNLAHEGAALVIQWPGILKDVFLDGLTVASASVALRRFRAAD
jgi:hypothetical protein